LYNFDQAISGAGGATALVPARFHVYNTLAATATPIGTAVTLSTVGPNTVAAFFPAGTLGGGAGLGLAGGPAVGISVAGGGASSPNAPPAGVGYNQDDEVGVANGATSTQTPGFTAGPDLINVTQSPIKDVFGTITSYAESYTFDQPLGTAAAPLAVGNEASFFIFDSDNSAFACTDPANTITGGWSAANPATVTCGVIKAAGPWGAATLNQQATAISAGVLGVGLGGAVPAVQTPAALGGFDNSYGYTGVTGRLRGQWDVRFVRAAS